MNWLLIASACTALMTGCSSKAPAPKASAAPQKKISAEPALPTIREFKIGDHGTLGFLLPKGWVFTPKKSNSPLTPYSFRIDAADKSAAIMVSISWDGIGGKLSTPTAEELERLLRSRASRQYMRHSVEKKTVVQEFQGTEMDGFYAQFTDNSWTHSEVPAGAYRVVTDGVFRCGNLWGSVTVYSQDKSGESFTPAFAMIKSFRRL